MIKDTINLLGRRATDKVSGLTGIITTVCFDLYGCVQVALSPKADEKGNVAEGRWLDVNRLDVSDEPAVMPVPDFEGRATKPADYGFGAADKPRMRD